MDTVERWRLDPVNPDPAVLRRAADVVRREGLVAFPTDTLYGLAADPWSEAAVARLFAVKGRDATRALPVIAADAEQIERCIAGLPRAARRLAARFWPGPLTLVIDASPGLAAAVYGEARTVAVRVPDHAVARGLAAAVGRPITSTSANRSGDEPAASPDDVAVALGADVDGLLDAGPTPGGLPSTIVDARTDTPRLVRSGAIAFSLILDVL
ncbi:MAG TPA: L-threonylcarbamoyladenylate synthase [Vicinamibacterales bacterium]